MELPSADFNEIRLFVTNLNNDYYVKIRNLITSHFMWLLPKEIEDFKLLFYEFFSLLNGVVQDGSPIYFDDKYIPLICRAIIFERLNTAQQIEIPRQKTINQELIRKLDEKLKSIDKYLNTPWFLNTIPMKMPSLSTYFNIQQLELLESKELSPREYDEKFHILMAPQLFKEDLEYFRMKCSYRRADIVVAYIDIDDFKTFNQRYTEAKIDQNLLPQLMMLFEMHCYYHGYAYRYGGDEYIFTLPNTSKKLALEFFESLQEKLKMEKFIDIELNPTISIGLFLVDNDCIYTNREIEEKADVLKNKAKASGKNRIIFSWD